MKPLGESVTWQIAAIACETGISPRELLELDPRMLWTIERYLISRAQKANQSAKR
jgi:hypothetical protein